MTDFIANCGEPEYGEVVVIKRFNGMLGALDFDCFFFFHFLRSLLSNVRGHYYCNNKKWITFSLTDGFGSVAGRGLVFPVIMWNQSSKKNKK